MQNKGGEHKKDRGAGEGKVAKLYTPKDLILFGFCCRKKLAVSSNLKKGGVR